jgi:hypothetical protein
MANIVNAIKLDYSLFRYASDKYTRKVNFYGGLLFPDTEDIETAIWDFGDGQVFEQVFSEDSYYTSVRNTLFKYATKDIDDPFFPSWRTYRGQTVSIPVPKFRVNHIFAQDGEYDVKLTLVKTNGTAYIGASQKVNIVVRVPEYSLPVNWQEKSNAYEITENVDLLFDVGTGNANYIDISSTVINPLQSALEVKFELLNINGRSDIDYIEWLFGDGTTHVHKIGTGQPVESTLSTIQYKYPLLSTELGYTPTVILYFNKNGKKQQISIQGQRITQQNRVETSVSYSVEGIPERNPISSDESPYAFNMTPVERMGLPVDAEFTMQVTKDLEFVIWRFGDGTYDVVPVKYLPGYDNVKQYHTFTHRYLAPDYNCIPDAIFVYNIPGKGYISQRYRSYRRLVYDKGFDQPNYFKTISDISSYTRNLHIHAFMDHQSNQSGTLHVRVDVSGDESLSFADINVFSKLSWNIGGRTVIQDKNSTKNFGYVAIENFITPEEVNSIDIAVDIYAAQSDIINPDDPSELVLISSLSFLDVLIYNKDIQQADTEGLREFYSSQPGRIEYGGILSDFNPGNFIEEGNTRLIPVVVAKEEQIPERIDGLITRSVVEFDKLFSADNPVANFLNRDNPSTVSTKTGRYLDKRSVGYFTPDKTAIILVEPGMFNFTVSLDGDINFNKPYYFPDPFKYGSRTDVLDFHVDVNAFHKGYALGRAHAEPNTSEDHISFYGYTSQVKPETNRDLSLVTDQGYLDDAKSDLAGNLFGLFKDTTIINSNVSIPGTGDLLASTSIIFNGYEFYDSFFGNNYQFPYDVESTYGKDVRIPGWGSNRVVGFTDTPQTTLTFGKFSIDLNLPNKTVINVDTICDNPPAQNTLYCDCGFFTVSDGTSVLDPKSSEDTTWPGNRDYYYTELFEGGAHTAVPYNRPTSTSAASFSEVVSVSGTDDVFDADACYFTSTLLQTSDPLNNRPPLARIGPDASNKTILLPEIEESTMSLIQRENLPGTIYIKNTNNEVSKFIDALPYLEDKYGETVYADMSSNITAFDMIYNTYFIQTHDRIIIDKVKYTGKHFTSPGTGNTIIEYNKNPFNKVSNRFKVKDSVYFVMLSAMSEPNNSEVAIVPRIYKYKTNNDTLVELTIKNFDISDFVIDNINTLYVHISQVHLTYNEQANRFNVSYILKDSNQLPYIISTNFVEHGEIHIKDTFAKQLHTSSYESFEDQTYLNTFLVVQPSNASSISPTITSNLDSPGLRYKLVL